MLVVLALAASANDMVGERSRPDGLISQIQITLIKTVTLCVSHIYNLLMLKNGIIISNVG